MVLMLNSTFLPQDLLASFTMCLRINGQKKILLDEKKCTPEKIQLGPKS